MLIFNLLLFIFLSLFSLLRSSSSLSMICLVSFFLTLSVVNKSVHIMIYNDEFSLSGCLYTTVSGR